jgi:hypothetical protein
MKIDESIEKALHAPDPVKELRSLVEGLLAQGQSEETVLATLERARSQLRVDGREKDEDAVMDVMDFVVGWCSPRMRLSPASPPAGQIPQWPQTTSFDPSTAPPTGLDSEAPVRE